MKRTRSSHAAASASSASVTFPASDATAAARMLGDDMISPLPTPSATRPGIPRKFARAPDGSLIDVAATAEIEASTAAVVAAAAAAGPSSVLVQFQGMAEASPAGSTLDVPLGVTPAQLELLINQILGAAEPTPYSFYLNGIEVVGDLRTALSAQRLSAESIHTLRYQPLAVFRVMPVARCTDSMPGHADAVLHVSFSPDGGTLASGGGDAMVRFWDTASCTPRHTCAGHSHHVLATAWSPDGTRFASADKLGEVRVWNPRTGKETCAPLRGHSAWVTSLAWEPLHRAPLPSSDGDGGDYVSPCELLASSSKDKSVRVWNTRSGRIEFVLSGHTDSVEAVRWGGEGLVYTASRDRSINVYAIEGGGTDGAPRRGKLVRSLAGHGHRVNALALSTNYLCRTGPFTHRRVAFASGAAGADASVC